MTEERRRLRPASAASPACRTARGGWRHGFVEPIVAPPACPDSNSDRRVRTRSSGAPCPIRRVASDARQRPNPEALTQRRDRRVQAGHVYGRNMRITTSRVVLDEIADDDVDALLDVRRSNPEYLARTEGSSGEVGHYDRSMLERDLSVACLDPSRQILAVRLSSQTTPIGLVDLLREHPSDHLPWIGAIELHSQYQRQSYGREIVQALVDWARSELEAAAVRASADEDHSSAREFLEASGFVEVDRRERRGPAGETAVVVYEHRCR